MKKSNKTIEENNVDMEAKASLLHFEGVISSHLKSYYKVGEALTEIRNDKLYKAASFKTFGDYCLNRFSISRLTGYRYMAFYKVATVLGKDESWLVAERVVRELAKEHDNMIIMVWDKATELATIANSVVTIRHIKDAKRALSDNANHTENVNQSVEFFMMRANGSSKRLFNMVKEYANNSGLSADLLIALRDKHEELLLAEMDKRLEAFSTLTSRNKDGISGVA